MTMDFGIIFAVPLFVALAITPLVRIAALKLGVVDRSDGKRKLHPEPVPLLGGVSLFLAMSSGVAVTVALGGAGAEVIPLVLSAGLICLVGWYDDLWTLEPRWKLLGQIIATIPIVVASQGVDHVGLFGWEIGLGWWSVPFTICWLLAGINALNFLDGVDGLAALTGLCIVATTATIADALGNHEAFPVAVALAGALAGLLVYNLPPARIFLGDAGSMTIGLLAAYFAMRGVPTAGGTVDLATLAAVMCIPLMDMTLAVVRRVLTGQAFWRADRYHIHHRLLDQRFSAGETTLFLGTLSIVCGAGAVASAVTGHSVFAWLACGGLTVGLVRGGYFGNFEYTLVKRSLTRVALAMSARLWLGGQGAAALPTRKELVDMSFPDAWHRLCRTVERLGVEQLEITLGRKEAADWRTNWGPRVAMLENSELWLLDVRFDDAEGGWCRFRVRFRGGVATHPWNWLSISQALKVFGRHWSSRAREAPTTQLFVVGGEPPDRAAA